MLLFYGIKFSIKLNCFIDIVAKFFFASIHNVWINIVKKEILLFPICSSLIKYLGTDHY